MLDLREWAGDSRAPVTSPATQEQRQDLNPGIEKKFLTLKTQTEIKTTTTKKIMESNKLREKNGTAVN